MTTDYEMRDTEGNSVAFGDETGSWICSHLQDIDKARTFLRPGLHLYKRTITQTYEEVK